MRTQPSPHRLGFSLVELMTVVIIMGLLSITALPAMSTMRGAREHGAAAEISRWMMLARSRAMTEGSAFGVEVSPADETLRLMRIPVGGGTPEVASGALGVDQGTLDLTGAFAGVEILSVQTGQGVVSTTTHTAWFDVDGTPHARTGAGVHDGEWTAHFEVNTSGTHGVRVRKSTGVIERW